MSVAEIKWPSWCGEDSDCQMVSRPCRYWYEGGCKLIDKDARDRAILELKNRGFKRTSDFGRDDAYAKGFGFYVTLYVFLKTKQYLVVDPRVGDKIGYGNAINDFYLNGGLSGLFAQCPEVAKEITELEQAGICSRPGDYREL